MLIFHVLQQHWDKPLQMMFVFQSLEIFLGQNFQNLLEAHFHQLSSKSQTGLTVDKSLTLSTVDRLPPESTVDKPPTESTVDKPQTVSTVGKPQTELTIIICIHKLILANKIPYIFHTNAC
jgi:hypothetical protein